MMWELKKSSDEVDKEKTIGALLLKGMAVLQDQYPYQRARVVAVLLCKFKLRILIMDRSGAYFSPVVDVEDQPDLLIRTVLGFLLAQDNHLGIEYSGDTDDSILRFRESNSGQGAGRLRHPFTIDSSAVERRAGGQPGPMKARGPSIGQMPKKKGFLWLSRARGRTGVV